MYMSPENIGRYEIDREISRGGMAVVYLARDPLIKRQVAIKVIPRQFTSDPEFRVRFQREAEAVAALEHPAIVPIYDLGEHDGQPFIVMRHMVGGSLVDKLEGGALLLPYMARILTRLAWALDQAHARGIFHRDIKPGNVLFDPGGEAYLSDFGIVKMSEASIALTGEALIGTPAYMSPEQVRGEMDLDGRIDVYSLGILLFEMLTGELPYNADTPIKLALEHVGTPVPNILEVKPDIPAGLRSIIEQALAKVRDERYSTPGELAHAFADAVGYQQTARGRAKPAQRRISKPKADRLGRVDNSA